MVILNRLRAEIEKEDYDAIKIKKEALEKTMMEVGQSVYNDPAASTENTQSPKAENENDNVIDTDFTE